MLLISIIRSKGKFYICSSLQQSYFSLFFSQYIALNPFLEFKSDYCFNFTLYLNTILILQNYVTYNERNDSNREGLCQISSVCHRGNQLNIHHSWNILNFFNEISLISY